MVKLAFAGAVTMISFIALATLVIDSERRSDLRAGILPVAVAPAVAHAGPEPADIDARSPDGPARAAATDAVGLAQRVFERHATFAWATTARLAEAGTGLIFVDGRSTAPGIVSVAPGDSSWAAAVMSTSGTCFWARASATGQVRFGTGLLCTGRAAMAASRTTW
jgi:hypothetical protein